MTTILNASDFHVDAVTAGYRRFEDVKAALDETIDAAIEHKADYYLFTGDYCDPDGGGDSFGYAELLLRAAIMLADSDIRSIWLAGNHDVVESGSGYTTLTPLRALVESRRYGHMVTLFEEPGIMSLRTLSDDGKGAQLLALPFTSHDRSYDPAERVRYLSRLMLNYTGPIVIAGHLNIEGIEVGSETTDFPRGRDVFFPLEACRGLGVDREIVMVNGHYHKRQCFNGIHIPGSVARLTFGEEDHSPAYQLIEV